MKNQFASYHLINTKNILTQTAANITVGFVLTFITICLWSGALGLLPISGVEWLLILSLYLVSLWLLYSRIIQLSGKLFNIYAQALDGWSIILCCLELIILTIHLAYKMLHIFIKYMHFQLMDI